MRKSDKHIAFLNYGSFPGYIMFTCGFNYQEIEKICKRKYSDYLETFQSTKPMWDSEETWGFSSHRVVQGISYFFVCIKERFNFSDKHQRLLAHELMHAVIFNLKDLLDIEHEHEAVCYTHTHLMEQCHRILRSK